MTGPSTKNFTAAAALSDHIDTRTAAMEVAEQLQEQLGEGEDARPDLVLAFASFHHLAAFQPAGETIRSTLNPRVLLGCTAESVLGVDREWEGRAGLSAIGLRLPDVALHPFRVAPEDDRFGTDDPVHIRERFGIDDETQAVLLLADPFSTPVARILALCEQCRGEGFPNIPVAGGLSSGSSRAGHNVLLLDDQRLSSGFVGVTIGGGVEIDFLVSQGCRPIGEPLVVTRAERNVLFELGGRPAVQAIHDIAQEAPEKDRELLSKGLFVGVVIDEYKDRFGRGDFLIRNVVGIDRDRQAIAIAEPVKAGRTVQLHVRDAETAGEDLHLLLDLQELKGEPFAAAVFTCNGRGTRLFEESDHDIRALRSRLGEIPIAGFFAAGEIGPIGERSFVHGHTLSAMLFRRPEADTPS